VIKPNRPSCLAALLLAASSTVWFAQTAGAAPPPRVKRVRAADRQVAGMMDVASERSATFRRLVLDLEQSDIIVYVSMNPHLPATTLGRVQFVCARGRYRYLRVSVRPRLAPRDFVATVAHELQHAREIAGHPDVVDAESMAALYARIGRPSCTGFETVAAIRVSDLVNGEFESGPVNPSPAPR
jgi:hypothetical protein